jgi:hypothetical protein
MNLRIPEELFKAIRALADEREQTLTQVVVEQLEALVRGQGGATPRPKGADAAA